MVLLNLLFNIYALMFAEGAYLRCYRKSIDDYTVTPLSEPLPILNSSCFDASRSTVIYTFGFGAKKDGPVTTIVIQSYIDYGKVNFILLDWEKEASTGMLGAAAGYVASGVPQAMKIGAQLGSAIITMSNNGLDIQNLQLIAHSLGAHLMGYAGKQVKKEGKIVGRITGLDPSGPLYSGALSMKGLEANCAEYVDVIHTDPGTYGITDSIGNVDIWANCDMNLQPGCPPRNYELLNADDRCSHDRAPKYYVETLQYPEAFAAIKASSCKDWSSGGSLNKSEIVYIGEITNSRGNFYLRTNSASPYGEGIDGTKP
ncbi:lipase member H-B-like isoform X2 [Leptidea sinapis]|uniref:lipase member H-B-like isoform X2 n=1 Tax=Leptidea sinapis TaxID=189913 RepID=UPI002135DA45|nr:lipase member H-B-like isoform X2 [Leptidea sinapis]